jgi:hypothetical protein
MVRLDAVDRDIGDDADSRDDSAGHGDDSDEPRPNIGFTRARASPQVSERRRQRERAQRAEDRADQIPGEPLVLGHEPERLLVDLDVWSPELNQDGGHHQIAGGRGQHNLPRTHARFVFEPVLGRHQTPV